MRILIDLDGTAVDTMGEAVRRGLFVNHPPCRWDFVGCCTPVTYDDVFASPNIFLDAAPMASAIDGIALLRQSHDVHFASTPWPSVHDSARQKYEWVERWFGDPTMLTLTHHKDGMNGDVLIDDKPNLVGPWRQVTYSQPWNEGTFTWRRLLDGESFI